MNRKIAESTGETRIRSITVSTFRSTSLAGIVSSIESTKTTDTFVWLIGITTSTRRST